MTTQQYTTRRLATVTRSRNPLLVAPLIHRKKQLPMISATHLRNHLLNDALVDYLKMYDVRPKNMPPNFSNEEFDSLTQFIMAQGNKFESELVKYIHDNVLPVVHVTDRVIDDNTLALTKQYMQEGAPIIHGAAVQNIYNNTRGVIDLLVRSDKICHLVDECPLTESEQVFPAPKLEGDYHYVVIDIKFSTLPLRADGIHLLNQGSYKFYKSQLYIYSKAVGHMQGYMPPYAFILGRRWKYTSSGVVYNGLSCLERLGKVDYEGVDKDYPTYTQNAIKWRRDLIRDGHKWSINPPSRDELYPNMCHDSGKYNDVKKTLALELGDITLLWFCGVKNREIGFSNNVYSFYDEKCQSDKIGAGPKRGEIIDKMIAINQQDRDVIRPKKIKTGINQWRQKCKEVFVDFETFLDVCFDPTELPYQKKTDMIFMIGVGWTENGRHFSYKNFICNEATYKEEYRIMNEFVEFMRDMGGPKMWHWCAEEKFWTSAENRQFDYHEDDIDTQNNISDNWQVLGNWADLSEVFKSEPVVLRRCFGFGLKDVAEQMRTNGMITAKIESICDSGKNAMVQAIQAYTKTTNPATSSIMNDISVYNNFDTRVLWEILEYLRQNH